jgi:hypothetical protein
MADNISFQKDTRYKMTVGTKTISLTPRKFSGIHPRRRVITKAINMTSRGPHLQIPIRFKL